MKQNPPRTLHAFRRLYPAALVLLPVFAALQAGGFYLAMARDFDAAIGHFQPHSAGFALFVSGIVLSILLSVCLSAAARRTVSLLSQDGQDHLLLLFAAILTALLAVIGLFAGADLLRVQPDASLPRKISVVLLPFLALSMLLSLFPSARFSHVRQAAAMLAVLSINLSIFADYFQFDLPLNSPVRYLTMLTKCAALLYLLAEAQLSFHPAAPDAEPAAQKKFSLPFVLFAAGLAASVSLGFSAGALLCSLLHPAPAGSLPSVYTLALYAAIGLHAFGRLLYMRPLLGAYRAPAPRNVPPQTETSSI